VDYEYTRVAGFLDANWARSPVDRRSANGFCFFLRENLIMKK